MFLLWKITLLIKECNKIISRKNQTLNPVAKPIKNSIFKCELKHVVFTCNQYCSALGDILQRRFRNSGDQAHNCSQITQVPEQRKKKWWKDRLRDGVTKPLDKV